MRKIYSILLCFLFIVSATFSVSAASAVPEAVMNATESVVRVLSEYADGYATGSGFVIKSDKEETLIVTNYHVVEGKPHSISVWLSEEETVSASILAYTSQKDMCILRLAYPVQLNPLSLAKNGVKQGEAIYAVGFPGAADYLSDKEAHTSADATITDGIVSAVREATVSSYGTPTKILQINAAINAGNSGGPLFNINGEVVGINTYGINDSQGIFGAIEVSELITFLADNNITTTKMFGGFGEWMIAAIAVAILGTAVVLMIMKRKNKMKTTSRAERNNMPLWEYMVAHPNGIGISDAVAMLLPVALQLRDLHNNGRAHLQVSPNSIFVGATGAKLVEATQEEADRYMSGYAAPEIYRGTSAGNVSDIYSFCAVLFFVASGKQPTNSLTRVEFEAVAHDDLMFSELINKGMELDPANRYASMQEVIIKLSPYNTHPFTNATVPAEHNTQKSVAYKKGKRTHNGIILLVVAILLVGMVGTYVGCYFGARSNAEKGAFDAADKLLFIEPITKLHDGKLVSYIEAGQMLMARSYTAAKESFQSLQGYLNADQLVQEADYRRAIQYADSNDFMSAIEIMNDLWKAGYKDASSKTVEFYFRQGMYFLNEECDFYKANSWFSRAADYGHKDAEDMKKETQYRWAVSYIEEEKYVEAYEKLAAIRGYSDVDDAIKALEEVIYVEGQAFYKEGRYTDSLKRFTTISPFAESKKYITLIGAHTSREWDISPTLVADLLEIFYFEDAAELLLSGQTIAVQFLSGKWSGSGYYFTMEKTSSITYNLPWFDYGDYYRIENGVMLLFSEGKENDTKALFSFTAITPNCIEVFCYKNNMTYTLNRE